MKEKFRKKPEIILAFYIICVIFITVLSLRGAKTETVSGMYLGTEQEDEIELLDDILIEVSFVAPKAEMTGISLDYDANGVFFKEEYLIVDFYNYDRELLQRKNIVLAEQKSNRQIYVKLDFDINAGEEVLMTIRGYGLHEQGPKIWMSESSGAKSVLKINGDLQVGKSVCARAWYYKIQDDTVKVIISGIIVLLIGFFIFVLYKSENLPLFCKDEKKVKVRDRRNRKQIGNILIGLVFVWAGLFLILDYTYKFAVKEPANATSYYVLNEKMDNSVPIVVKGNVEFVQKIQCPTDNLSGIGFVTDSIKGKSGNLVVEAYDAANGNLLTKGTTKISKLKKLSKLVDGKLHDSADLTKLKKYIGINFNEVIQKMKGETIEFHFYVQDAEDAEITLFCNEESKLGMRGVSIDGSQIGYNLCCIVLYKASLFLKIMFLVFSILMLIVVTSAYYFVYVKGSLNIEKIFLPLVYLLGIAFMLLITIYGVPDETAHIDTVYRVSNMVMGIPEAQGPNQIYKRTSDIDIYDINKVDVTLDSLAELKENIFSECENPELQATYGENTLGNATIFNFLPAALGFTIARLLNWGFIPMVLLGRFFNLLVAGFMMYWAIKRTPIGKEIFAVVGLLPITLQQIASCSYDAVLMGTAFLFCSYCLALAYQENKVCLIDYAVFFASMIVLISCKGGAYLPIACISFIIPFLRKRKIAKKINLLQLAGVASMGALILIVFSRQYASKIFGMLTAAQGEVYGRVENVELYSMQYFISKPLELFRIIENTFVLLGDYYLQQIGGGLLGRLNLKVTWVIVVAFIVLLLIAALRRPEEDQMIMRGHKWFIGVMCLGSVMLIAMSMLLSWTPYGDKAILGIQGRYFLPFLVFIMLLFRNSKIVYADKSPSRIVFVACILDVCTLSQVISVVL